MTAELAQLARVPPSVTVLEPFVAAGVLGSAEVHLAATVVRLAGAVPDDVVLALAVAARGPRLGHVCIELDDVGRLVVDRPDDRVDELPWPPTDRWAAALEASDLVASPGSAVDDPVRPLVWDGSRLYLQRYWVHETAVASELTVRSSAARAQSDPAVIDTALTSLFGPAGSDDAPDLQRRAAAAALANGLSVIVGGPGTGKTRTVARLLAAAKLAAAAQGRPLEVALAAPTGKAAARMTEAVHLAVEAAVADDLIPDEVASDLRGTQATTIHRLLGWAPGTAFRHDRTDPLPHDLVVIDETSMVAVPLMARLLDAIRPDAQVVLVGDPYQLASVEAGTVLGDVVGPVATVPAPDTTAAGAASPLAGLVTVLRRTHRFGEDSGIAALAEAVRIGDVEAALVVLREGRPDVRWVRDDDAAGLLAVEHEVVDAGVEAASAALAGLGAAGLVAATRTKVLAATRHGRFGVYDWSDRIEAAVAARVPELAHGRRWYVGRPVIVTANDPVNRVANGDIGLVVSTDEGLAVALAEGDGLRLMPTSRLDRVDTWWAMTVHKSQGSEFDHAVVSLPAGASPVLTRELVYTAVTRAKQRLTIVSSERSLRAAIERPVSRASGLRDRLWPSS